MILFVVSGTVAGVKFEPPITAPQARIAIMVAGEAPAESLSNGAAVPAVNAVRIPIDDARRLLDGLQRAVKEYDEWALSHGEAAC